MAEQRNLSEGNVLHVIASRTQPVQHRHAPPRAVPACHGPLASQVPIPC
jgi:hypothetical protein